MNKTKLKEIFSIENRTEYFSQVLLFLCIVSIALFSLLLVGNNALSKKNQKQVSASAVNNPFSGIHIEAKAAMVWDVVNEREIFSKEADEPLPLASLTKVMTALTLESNPDKVSKIQITQNDLIPEGDSGLVVGDTWEASDLLDFTLLTSSNDGAFALAALNDASADPQIQFIKMMNDKAVEIGLSNSKFFNPHGLDREIEKGGAYGSAHDMAILFEYTLKNYPKILEATRYKNLQFASAEKIYNAENTNPFVDQVPNLIASKTGYTDLAGGNLVIAYDAGLNRPIIISVLGSSQEGRFTDALKLVEASLKYIHDN